MAPHKLVPLWVYYNDENRIDIVSDDIHWLPPGVPEFMLHVFDYYTIHKNGYYYLTGDGKILTSDGLINWDEPLPGGWAWNQATPFCAYDETAYVYVNGEWVYMNAEGAFSSSGDFLDPDRYSTKNFRKMNDHLTVRFVVGYCFCIIFL